MFSIIIPVYNAAKYLQRSVESVLSQDSEEFELILVDDGSTDKSAEICDEYAHNDIRVKVYHQENKGASVARNKGIELASGEWITFIDADDEVASEFITILNDASINSDADIIFFGYSMRFSNMVKDYLLETRRIDTKDYSYVYTDCEITTPWSKLFRRNLLIDNNIRFDGRLANGEDTLFMAEALCKTNVVSTFDRLLYIHYVIDGSLSAKVVPLDLNLMIIQRMDELINQAKSKFYLNDKAEYKLCDLQSICIGRVLYMNIPKGKYKENSKLLDSLDLELYSQCTKPKTFRGRIFNYLLRKRCYALLDMIALFSN